MNYIPAMRLSQTKIPSTLHGNGTIKYSTIPFNKVMRVIKFTILAVALCMAALCSKQMVKIMKGKYEIKIH